MKQLRKSNTPHIEKLFLKLIIIFGLLALFIQPIFNTPDEQTHFYQANTIFFRQSVLSNNKNLDWKDSIDIYRSGEFLQKYYIQKVEFTKESRQFTLNLSFSKLKWLPQALGMLLGILIHPSFGVIILLGRLFNLLIYIGGIYLAIKKAKFGKLPMTMVALLPISVQQATSLSYDVLFFVSIFACFSLLTNLWTRKEKLTPKWYLYIFLTILLLFIPKPSSLILGLYFVTLPTSLLGQNKIAHYLEKFWQFCTKFKGFVGLFIIAATIAFIGISFRHYGGTARGIQTLYNTFFRPEINNTLDNIMTTGIIGSFGTMIYWLPEWLVIINFLLYFTILLNERNEEVKFDKRVIVSSWIIYILNMLIVAVFMFVSWTVHSLNSPTSTVSFGSQGRYYTPFLLVFIPIAIYASKYIKFSINQAFLLKIFKIVIVSNMVLYLSSTLFVYYTQTNALNLLPHIVQWIRRII
jgi:uncharacterized membrane protein